MRVLADSGFDSNEFIDGVNQLGIHGVIGARGNRDIGEGQHLYNLRYQGTRVRFKSCDTRVYVAWFQLRQARGGMVWRYVISTRAAEGKTITRWGKRRWRIEAFFKTMKSRFGLDQFGQRTALGAMRFLLLAFLAFLLTYWTALESMPCLSMLDWGRAARLTRDDLVPEVIARDALRELRRVKPILESRGVTCYTDFI